MPEYLNLRLTKPKLHHTISDMANAKSSGQKRHHEFRGEETARLLVRTLNDELGPAARGRRDVVDPRPILALVKRLQRLDTYLKSVGPKVQDEMALLDKFRAVNRILWRYEAVPSLIPKHFYDPDADCRGWRMEWGRTGKRQQPYVELGLVLNALQLAESGQIQLVRQCEQCNRWLFAKFAHQKYCSQTCKDQFNRNNPHARERRRKWARENYHLHRTKNIK